MKKVPLMKEVEPQNDMILKVKFENNIIKIIDIKPYLKIFKPFKALKDKKLFNQAKIDMGGFGIIWNDKIDLSRYDIWEFGEEIKFLK
ncbi:MAG: DUF2442 domain-containing protein [Elusimicrobiota bacterium]|jgi:hypothetical protein|nr:DUF2442 domain-containing protein [Elusimicrobiota bacterium]